MRNKVFIQIHGNLRPQDTSMKQPDKLAATGAPWLLFHSHKKGLQVQVLAACVLCRSLTEVQTDDCFITIHTSAM